MCIIINYISGQLVSDQKHLKSVSTVPYATCVGPKTHS